MTLLYKRIGKFEIKDVLPFVVKPVDLLKAGIRRGSPMWNARAYKIYLGKRVSMTSLRYRVFRQSLVCANCGVEGVFFALEKHTGNPGDKYHFNLYGLNEDNHEVMLTKDHIIPRSKGGPDALPNMQTLCKVCNELKADRIIPVGTQIIR